MNDTPILQWVIIQWYTFLMSARPQNTTILNQRYHKTNVLALNLNSFIGHLFLLGASEIRLLKLMTNEHNIVIYQGVL